jgi:hypothetical protein
MKAFTKQLTFKIIYLGFIISLFSIAIQAQEANLEWAQSIGGTSDDYSSSITVDATGNVYITGYYNGTVDFDPGIASFNLTSNGGSDFFIQKLDASGGFIWARSIGGTSYESGYTITTDANGNIYASGEYRDTVDFDPGAGTFNLISNGENDIYILKLDGNGDFIWAKSTGGTANDHVKSITTDFSGNIIMTGDFAGTADFDPGLATFNLTSNGELDVYVQKLDASGNFIWAKSMGGPYLDFGNAIVADASGDLYVTGYYSLTVDFDPNTTTFNLTSNGEADIFVQKIDTDGDFVWAKSMGGSHWDSGNAITTDASGNLYVTGSYINIVDFDPGPSIFNLTSNGEADVFIQKLDANGVFIWAKSLGGQIWDYGHAITCDTDENVYIAGNFSSPDFDPGAANLNLISNGSYDVFIQMLDANGGFIWAKSVGGQQSDFVSSIDTNPSGNVYVTGTFKFTVDFDPGAATNNLTSNGNDDCFILKLSQSFVGVEDYIPFNRVSILPNPTQGLVNIQLGNLKDVSVNVYSVSGQLIYEKENINASSHQFELNEAPGIYLVEVGSQGEKRISKLVRN